MTIKHGTNGDDTLIGTNSNDTLDGRGGNDTLDGLGGNDQLIGGAGADNLNGGSGTGEDLLIAGSTDFENDLTDLSKLMDIFNEWTSAADYNTRINHLTGSAGGLNGTTFLNNTTVHDDGVKDVLSGGLGLDWFFVSALDKFTLKPGELSVTI